MNAVYKHCSLSLDDLADPTAVIDEVASQLEELAHPAGACVSVLCRVRAGRKVLDQLRDLRDVVRDHRRLRSVVTRQLEQGNDQTR